MGEKLDLLRSAFQSCVCVWVIYLPTPLAPITPTHNPNVTPSVTSCHTSRLSSKVHAHRCTHAHKSPPRKEPLLPPSFALEDTRRPGMPNVGLCQCSSVCGCNVLSVSLLADCSLGCISGRAPVPRLSCPAVHLGLWSSGKPKGAVGRLRPHKTFGSAPGVFGVLVSQWEWCHISAQTRRLTNVTAAPCDGWADESYSSKWKCESPSLSLGSRSIKVDQFYNATHQIIQYNRIDLIGEEG